MAEANISRRSTRLFDQEQGLDIKEIIGAATMAYESRNGSGNDEKDKEKPLREAKTSGILDFDSIPLVSKVDLGRDLSGLFSTTVEHASKYPQTVTASSEEKGDARPLNFGTVLLGIYRSSFPMAKDFQYLGKLRLRTVVSLVNQEFSPEFKDFMTSRGIRHCIIEMEGTKKVAIPDAVMKSILKVVLNQENHPLLIHCNHGKHRTGCVAAVMRHIAGWNIEEIIREYRGFADIKARDCDIKYITEYDVSKLAGLFSRIPTSTLALTSAKMQKLLVITMSVLAVWITTAVFLQDRNH